jgi:hypothetical protein
MSRAVVAGGGRRALCLPAAATYTSADLADIAQLKSNFTEVITLQ